MRDLRNEANCHNSSNSMHALSFAGRASPLLVSPRQVVDLPVWNDLSPRQEEVAASVHTAMPFKSASYADRARRIGAKKISSSLSDAIVTRPAACASASLQNYR
jgi:hypothetical protein